MYRGTNSESDLPALRVRELELTLAQTRIELQREKEATKQLMRAAVRAAGEIAERPHPRIFQGPATAETIAALVNEVCPLRWTVRRVA
jgi:hypothetical protein